MRFGWKFNIPEDWITGKPDACEWQPYQHDRQDNKPENKTFHGGSQAKSTNAIMLNEMSAPGRQPSG